MGDGSGEPRTFRAIGLAPSIDTISLRYCGPAKPRNSGCCNDDDSSSLSGYYQHITPGRCQHSQCIVKTSHYTQPLPPLQYRCFPRASPPKPQRRHTLYHMAWRNKRASAGNRIRVTSMATRYSTTRPQTLNECEVMNHPMDISLATRAATRCFSIHAHHLMRHQRHSTVGFFTALRMSHSCHCPQPRHPHQLLLPPSSVPFRFKWNGNAQASSQL